MLISIIMPVYNEVDKVKEAIEQAAKVQLPSEKEIIVINDGSTDGTKEKLETVSLPFLKVLNMPVNKGKGAALREGFKKVSGEIVIIQDADLEYSPVDYVSLLEPIIADKADVVYGTRFLGGGGPHRVHLFWHSLGNQCLTMLSNMLTDLNLSDMEVGAKVFRSAILKQIELKENRFGFEPEFTAKVAKLKCRIYEVPISYYGRTYAEGKKIGWKDGFVAIWCILKYNLLA